MSALVEGGGGGGDVGAMLQRESHMTQYGTMALGQKALERHIAITLEEYMDAPWPRQGLLNAAMTYESLDATLMVDEVDTLANDMLVAARTLPPADLMQYNIELLNVDEQGGGDPAAAAPDAPGGGSFSTPGDIEAATKTCKARVLTVYRRAENMGLINVVLPHTALTMHDALTRIAQMLNLVCTSLIALRQQVVVATFPHFPGRATDPTSPFRMCPFGYRAGGHMPLEDRVANPRHVNPGESMQRVGAMLAEGTARAKRAVVVAGGDPSGTASTHVDSLDVSEADLDMVWGTNSVEMRLGGANTSGNGGGPLQLPTAHAPSSPKGSSKHKSGTADAATLTDLGTEAKLSRHPPATVMEQLLRFLMRRAQHLGQQHDGTTVYERTWYGNQPTCAWRPVRRGTRELTLHNWVYDQISLHCTPDQASLLMRTSPEMVVTNLVNFNVFPRLEHNRSIVAFRNGVVQTAWKNPATGQYQARWLSHADPELASEAAFFYIDEVMDPDWWDEALFPDPALIPTPAWDTILDTQHFDADTRAYFWGLTGRCLAPFHVADKEQLLSVIVGVAGSGKSTYLNKLMEMFPKSLVRSLATDMTSKWAGAFLDGCAFYCLPEMKATLTLSLGTIQRMVSGETIIAEPKGLKQYNVVIEANGIFCGNEMPLAFIDQGGAMQRRIVFWPMMHRPQTEDSGLEHRMSVESAAAFAKAIRAYHGLNTQCRNTREARGDGRPVSYRDIMPQQLQEMQQQLKQETQPMAHLLSSTDYFEFAPVEARKFWSSCVQYQGRRIPGTPYNGVTPDTHPDLYDAASGEVIHQTADGRDYIMPDGTVYGFLDYCVTEKTFRKVWDFFVDEQHVTETARRYNGNNVRYTAPNMDLFVVQRVEGGGTSLRDSGGGGAAAGEDAPSKAQTATAASGAGVPVYTFAVHGIRLTEAKRSQILSPY